MMRALIDRCRELALFDKFADETLAEIAEKSSWFSLAGGSHLFLEGETSEQMYFVLSGRLIIVRRTSHGEEVVGYVGAGEPVGEMSILAGDDHSASVFALRDTEIVALSRDAVSSLFDEHVDFAGAVARAILKRARHPAASFKQSAPRVFALIAASRSIDIDVIARQLGGAISRYGRTVRVLTEDDFDSAQDFEDIEDEYDVVLCASRVGDSLWYRFVLRHADRLFVFARRDGRPPRPFPLSPTEESPARRFRLVDIVIVHEGQAITGVADWVDAVDANRIFHWRGDASRDRLARAIAGRTVALVLSGGGARAYAHIGAVRALRERGVPIDYVSGASMGAIIAACVAMGWDDAEIKERIRDAFVSSNPLGDHVLPVVALTRGRLVEERLAKHFGETLIEDLTIPFLCVSSELTKGEPHVHRRGSLRHALRATISLPGILPPVVEGDRLLVDGAVMNNFPTDLVANLHRGVTLGVDVARRGTISAEDYLNPPGFLSWVRQHGFSEAPPIVPLLMRSATAGISLGRSDHPADILVTPSVSGVQLRDWKKFDVAVADGYEATSKALEENWDTLRLIAEPHASYSKG